jgi:hypothetical protein
MQVLSCHQVVHFFLTREGGPALSYKVKQAKNFLQPFQGVHVHLAGSELWLMPEATFLVLQAVKGEGIDGVEKAIAAGL